MISYLTINYKLKKEKEKKEEAHIGYTPKQNPYSMSQEMFDFIFCLFFDHFHIKNMQIYY